MVMDLAFSVTGKFSNENELLKYVNQLFLVHCVCNLKHLELPEPNELYITLC